VNIELQEVSLGLGRWPHFTVQVMYLDIQFILGVIEGHGKGKVVPVLFLTEHHTMKAFLTSALDGGEWSASHPGHFTPREKAPGMHWIGGWVGPKGILDMVGKTKKLLPYSCQESNLGCQAPLPSHCTN
jgi:hypothetical protein